MKADLRWLVGIDSKSQTCIPSGAVANLGLDGLALLEAKLGKANSMCVALNHTWQGGWGSGAWQ